MKIYYSPFEKIQGKGKRERIKRERENEIEKRRKNSGAFAPFYNNLTVVLIKQNIYSLI